MKLQRTLLIFMKIMMVLVFVAMAIIDYFGTSISSIQL